ncbi:DUF4377 domain-containing protein [Flavimarina sp. Hel_I_48]|uniref:DUF4377 domain-containing protein n=1 Tax=Flavimarina sp. Hel_I_48 TaxID=1392488 RepID=UPI0009DF994F|nr:DUF4377 domain-containing protein [Flavimarina sp. Hel_I_48]
MRNFFVVLIICLFCISCGGISTETLIVGSSKVPCTGESAQDCLQVKKDSTATWEQFYGNIEGFDYEPGYVYTLEVEKEQAKDSPADASHLKYTLKRILDKTKMGQDDLSLKGNFSIATFMGQSVADRAMEMKFNAKEGQVSGKGICNRFMGTFTTSGEKIKFSQAATTKMMCEKPELERDFFQAMNQVDHFTLKQDQLNLMKGDETVLTASLKTEE